VASIGMTRASDTTSRTVKGAPDRELIARWQGERDSEARRELIERYEGLVRSLAAKYVAWGEPFDDLAQVAWVALLKAVDRFEIERDVQFSTYATPTIVGEIRRHYRDRTWLVHVPRSVQELRSRVNLATGQLARDGVSPSAAALAEHLGVSTDEVLEAIHSESARHPTSISQRPDEEDGGRVFEIVAEERGFDDVEARMLLDGSLDLLTRRDRQVVSLRFGEGLTQSQIAERVGVSQMHVSRILRAAIETLRGHLEPESTS
jgi:RNA polymerase sigma-B factor